jgi:hypothetical protein
MLVGGYNQVFRYFFQLEIIICDGFGAPLVIFGEGVHIGFVVVLKGDFGGRLEIIGLECI